MSEDLKIQMPGNPDFQFEELSLRDIKETTERLALDGVINAEQLNDTQRIFGNQSETVSKSVLNDTKKEYKNIARVLQKQKEDLTDETAAKLETRQGRNLSQILLNSKKMFGDSDEMRDVKTAVREVEEALMARRDANVPMSLEELSRLENRYTSALDYCQHYVNVKTTHTGSARYELVLAKMNQLMDELGMVIAMKELVGAVEYEEYLKADCPYGILVAARILKISGKQLTGEAADAPEEEQEAEEVQAENVFSKEELEAMDQPSAKIARLISMMAKPQDIVSQAGTDDYDLTVYMYNLLKSFPKGAHAEYFNSGTVGYKGKDYKRTYKDSEGNKHIAGTLIGLIQGRDGKLTLKIGDVERELPYNRETIIGSVTINILDNEKIFGQECVNSTMSWLGDKNDTTNAVVVRNAALKIIKNRLGITPTDFNNISTENVRIIAVNAMKNAYTPEDIRTLLARLEKATNATEQMINGQETLELLHFREANIAKLRQKVQLAPAKQQQQDKKENEWTEDEEEVKQLLADLIYSKDTWESDENIEKSGVRMQKAVAEHSYAFFMLIKDKKLLSGMINKLPIPADSKVQMTEQFEQVRAEAVGDKKMAVALLGMANRTIISEAVKIFIQLPTVVNAFSDMEKKIDRMIESNSAKIQEKISEQVDRLLGAPVEEEDEFKGFEDMSPYVDKKGLGEETKKLAIQAGKKELEKTLEKSMSGDAGQGRFIKLVLKDYFTSVSTLDKRSMFASVIRDAKPVQKNAGQANGLEDEKTAGRYLGAVFKGAGPLLQKMLQGMPVESIPMGLRDAFDTVKSNLLPIPQEIVEAQLLSMVERSNGAVTKIEVSRALGAASVGQAFLCKIYGPSLSRDGKEVVVKLLRPDVRNRMMREKALMLDCAQRTNEGMRKTYEGQLERIEEELDLTIEARNVERGQIYNKSRNPETETDSVSSMKLNSLIMPTTNSMVIEKSPGTTVDKYISSLKEELRTELAPLMIRDANGEPVLGDKEDVKIQINAENFAIAGQIRARLSEKIASAQKRQEHLIILAEKWIQEGLFGEGFYHGDLHAGNIMIDDDCATVIDFGNATQLDEVQKEHVTRMMSAAYIGDYKMFCEGYHALMHKDEATENHFRSQKAQFERTMREVLNMGDGNCAGQRIGVALIKAQELGLELPASIFNFSQCQLRLQNTIEDLNKQIVKMQKTMENIDDVIMDTESELDAASIVRKLIVMQPNSARDMAFAAKYTLLNITREEFINAILDATEDGIEKFNSIMWDERFSESPYVQVMAAIEEAYNRKRENPELDVAEELQNNEDYMLYGKNNKKSEGLLKLVNSTDDNMQAIVDYMAEYKEKVDANTTLERIRAIQTGQTQVDETQKEAILKELAGKLHKQWGAMKSVRIGAAVRCDKDGLLDEVVKAIGSINNAYRSSIIQEAALNELIENYSADEMFGQRFAELSQRILELRRKYNDENEKDKINKEEMTKLRTEFSALWEFISMRKIDELRQIEVQGGEMVEYSNSTPNNFMSVMSTVLSENVGKMIKRLGVWGVSHANDFKNEQ